MSDGASKESQSTEALLFAAMDKQALRFIDMLNDETRDDDGRDKYDIQLKMRLFQMGQDWLIRRKKLKPDGGGQEGSAITDMRSWISDPQVKENMEKMMFDAGFVKVPAKKNGRPTLQEKPVHDRFKEYKAATKPAPTPGAGWSGLLGEEEI